MGSLSTPKPWVPYLNTNDCSQGFCSLHCPQWCYIIFPPPPPLEYPAGGKNSGPSFSPLVIAIIGILASAFLLVSYYAIISKYCGSSRRSRGRDQNRDPNEESGENNEDPSNHEPWHVANSGLDEALIRSIAVCKYKRGDGLVEGTECSVCLSEFQEDESLRLLPKCTHAFHVTCIDTWLKSHSNCPLCRANIVFVSPSPVMETVSNVESLNEIDGNDVVREDIEMVVAVEEEEEEEEEVSRSNGVLPKTQQARVLSDLGDLEVRDAIIEIADEDDPPIRRSVSMDYLCESRVLSIADVLHLKQDEIFQAEECQGDDGSWKQPAAAVEMSKCSSTRSRVLHCVMSPVAMKRSFSSGRFSFSRCGRGRNIMIPF